MSFLGGIGDAIGGAVGDVADLAGDVLTGDLKGAAGNILDLTGDAAQLAGIAAPVVSMFNPLAGVALGAGSSLVSDLMGEITKDDAKQNKQNNFGKLASANANVGAFQNAEASIGAADAGGDIFAQLAAMVGDKLQKNVESLIAKGEELDSGDKNAAFANSSAFIGEQERMKFVSQALGQLLPAVGQSMQNISKA